MSSSISVIIAGCHAAHLLPDTLDSLFAQLYPWSSPPELDVIVVDHGPTTAPPRTLATYPQVKYLHQPHPEMVGAYNAGLQESQGDYVVFLDPRDRLLPMALQIGLSILDTIPDCGFTVGLAEATGKTHRVTETVQELVEQSLGLSIYYSLLNGTYCDSSARFMFRRSVLIELGGFDASLAPAAHYDLYLRMATVSSGVRHNQAVVEQCASPDLTQVTDLPRHLRGYLRVLSQQRRFITRRQDYQLAYARGKAYWRSRFGVPLTQICAKHLTRGQLLEAATALSLLVRHYPQGLLHLNQWLR